MRQGILSKQAQKFLKRLPPKQAAQISRAILSLKTDPLPPDSKKRKGAPLYRVDIGEYRAVYDYDEQTATVYIVGKRNDSEVYRLLQRKWRG